MTAATRSVLKSKFGSGDVPDGSDFADMIDSSVNLLDTGTQNLSGPLNAPSATISTISNTTLTTTNATATNLTATSAHIGTLTVDNIEATVTVQLPFLSAYISGIPVISASAAASTKIPFTAEWTVGGADQFTVSANKIMYQGVSGLYHFTTTGSIKTSAPESLEFAWNVNGESLLPSVMFIETDSDYRVLALQAFGELKSGDESYLEISHATNGAFNLNVRSLTTVVRKL